ncbi:MAG: hypothetical protein ACOYLF_16115 [Blastocatellia bacterium]
MLSAVVIVLFTSAQSIDWIAELISTDLPASMIFFLAIIAVTLAFVSIFVKSSRRLVSYVIFPLIAGAAVLLVAISQQIGGFDATKNNVLAIFNRSIIVPRGILVCNSPRFYDELDAHSSELMNAVLGAAIKAGQCIETSKDLEGAKIQESKNWVKIRLSNDQIVYMYNAKQLEQRTQDGPINLPNR